MDEEEEAGENDDERDDTMLNEVDGAGAVTSARLGAGTLHRGPPAAHPAVSSEAPRLGRVLAVPETVAIEVEGEATKTEVGGRANAGVATKLEPAQAAKPASRVTRDLARTRGKRLPRVHATRA